jgi:hypothetical protein
MKIPDLEINDKSGNQNLQMQFSNITGSNTKQFSTEFYILLTVHHVMILCK